MTMVRISERLRGFTIITGGGRQWFAMILNDRIASKRRDYTKYLYLCTHNRAGGETV